MYVDCPSHDSALRLHDEFSSLHNRYLGTYRYLQVLTTQQVQQQVQQQQVQQQVLTLLSIEDEVDEYEMK